MRSALVLALVGVLGAGLPGLAHAGQPARPVVQVQSGAVRGVVQDHVAAWRGVPYAAAPVGDLRWRPPQPVAPWSGVREADALSPDCFQGRMPNLPGVKAAAPAPLSEDCLYLNVWRPERVSARQKLPVLVWIHGGGFVNGGSSSPETYGDALAKRGLVVVTFNYRLGRLGFFGHPGLTAEHPDEPKGDYGLMDQIAALRWVRANIAAFGGDPANVTVMGESAGGISINLLLGSPMGEGLFDRAIIQSGAGRDFLGRERRLSQDLEGSPSAESLGTAFAQRLGVESTGVDALAALRALPVEQINGDLNMMTLVVSGPRALYAGPVVDGRVVAMTPEAQYRQGRQRSVPVLIGATTADLSLEFAASKDAAFAKFGVDEAAARQLYDPTGQAPVEGVNRAIGGDRNMVEPARFVARAFAAQGGPVYQYRFGYVAEEKRAGAPWGADHASDVAFAFDRLSGVLDHPTAQDQAVATRLADYWANFARTGDPNGRGLPNWPRYEAGTDRLLSITPQGGFVGEADPLKARLDFMLGRAGGQ
nr:carboxylesterase family protein [uncultured Brevundimonas sp.]